MSSSWCKLCIYVSMWKQSHTLKEMFPLIGCTLRNKYALGRSIYINLDQNLSVLLHTFCSKEQNIHLKHLHSLVKVLFPSTKRLKHFTNQLQESWTSANWESWSITSINLCFYHLLSSREGARSILWYMVQPGPEKVCKSHGNPGCSQLECLNGSFPLIQMQCNLEFPEIQGWTSC